MKTRTKNTTDAKVKAWDQAGPLYAQLARKLLNEGGSSVQDLEGFFGVNIDYTPNGIEDLLQQGRFRIPERRRILPGLLQCAPANAFLYSHLVPGYVRESGFALWDNGKWSKYFWIWDAEHRGIVDTSTDPPNIY